MAVSKRIALIVDCDGTIAEDTTTRLLQHVKLKAGPFWDDVRQREKNGWEPTLAFMNLLIEHARKVPISAKTFAAVGKKVKLSPGIPQFFFDMKAFVRRKYGERGVSYRGYVVSGGIDEIIRATALNRVKGDRRAVNDFFGCKFAYDKSGVFVKSCG